MFINTFNSQTTVVCQNYHSRVMFTNTFRIPNHSSLLELPLFTNTFNPHTRVWFWIFKHHSTIVSVSISQYHLFNSYKWNDILSVKTTIPFSLCMVTDGEQIICVPPQQDIQLAASLGSEKSHALTMWLCICAIKWSYSAAEYSLASNLIVSSTNWMWYCISIKFVGPWNSLQSLLHCMCTHWHPRT